ncbi:MAG TPA: carboxylesterase family protein, partial [Pseudomonadaceae bacterium]|nr:carboxylesterase family protein [Pseudomonadaceae bacterium]
MRFIQTFSLTLLLGLSLSVQAQLPQPASTVQGLLQGTVEQGLAIFRGVPYAAAPVGANRWRAPKPLPQWAGLRMAEEFGPRCVQGNFAPGAEQPLTSEDCL